MAEPFGARLRRLRTERGWTRYEAAKRSGMTEWGLRQLEQKGSLGNVQGTTLQRLATLYNVTVDYLVRETEESHDTR